MNISFKLTGMLFTQVYQASLGSQMRVFVPDY